MDLVKAENPSNRTLNERFVASLGECSNPSCHKPARFRTHVVFVFCSNRCMRATGIQISKNTTSTLLYTIGGEPEAGTRNHNDARRLRKAIERTRKMPKPKYELQSLAGIKEWR